MLIYSVVLSVFTLGLLAFAPANLSPYDKGSAQQDALAQIIASNLRTPNACNNNLDLAFANIAFNPNLASTDTGQEVKVRVPQFEPNIDLIGANNIVGANTNIKLINLSIDSLRLSNARLLVTNGAIQTYHAALTLNSSNTKGFLSYGLPKKSAVFLSLDVDTNQANRVVLCREDNSDIAMCSRYGGVYNAAGNPRCSSPPPNQVCPAGQLFQGMSNTGNILCASIIQSCPAGEFMSGYSTSGQIICQTTPPTQTVTNPNTPPPLSQAEPSTGVWQQSSHGVDIPCPGGSLVDAGYGLMVPDGQGVEGLACYSIGFQCREVICNLGGGYANIFGPPGSNFLSNSGTTNANTNCGSTPLHSDKRMECVTGTPTRGAIKSTPKADLRLSDPVVGTTADDTLPVFDYLTSKCSYSGEKFKSPTADPTTGLPLVYTCDPWSANFGTIGYSRTAQISAPNPCSPATLPFGDPRGPSWLEYTYYGSWCQYEASKAAAGGTTICGVGEDGVHLSTGLVCENKGNDFCWLPTTPSNPISIEVYSCQ